MSKEKMEVAVKVDDKFYTLHSNPGNNYLCDGCFFYQDRTCTVGFTGLHHVCIGMGPDVGNRSHFKEVKDDG